MPHTVFQAISMSENGTLNDMGPMVVTVSKTANTKKGDPMKFATLTDQSGTIACTFWSPAAAMDIPSGLVIIEGTFKRGDYKGSPQVTIDKMVVKKADGSAVAQPYQNPPAGGGPSPTGAASVGNRRASAAMTALIDYGLACVRYASKQMVDRGENFGDALAASVFGSAMYGYKEGRAIAPPSPEAEAKRLAAVAEKARLAEEARLAAEAVLAGQPPESEESDDIPY